MEITKTFYFVKIKSVRSDSRCARLRFEWGEECGSAGELLGQTFGEIINILNFQKY